MANINNKDLLIWVVEICEYDLENDLIKGVAINDYSSNFFKTDASSLKFIFSEGLSEYNVLSVSYIIIEGRNCGTWLAPSGLKIKESPFLITNNLTLSLVYHGKIQVKHSEEGYLTFSPFGSLYPVGGKDWVGIMKMIKLGSICKAELWAFSDVKDFNKENLKYYEPDDDFSHGEILSFS